MAKPDPQTGGSQPGRTADESSSAQREAAGGDSEVEKSLDEQWGFRERKGGLASETKAGLAIIAILVCAFGYIAFSKYNEREQTIASTGDTGKAQPKGVEQETPPGKSDPEESDELLSQFEPADENGPNGAETEQRTAAADPATGTADLAAFEAPIETHGLEPNDGFDPDPRDRHQSPTTPPPPGTETTDASWALTDKDDPWSSADPAASEGADAIDADQKIVAREPGVIDPGFDEAPGFDDDPGFGGTEPGFDDDAGFGGTDPVASGTDTGPAKVALDNPDEFDDIFSDDALENSAGNSSADPWGDPGTETARQDPNRGNAGLSGRAVVTPAVQSSEQIDFDDDPITFDDPPPAAGATSQDPVDSDPIGRDPVGRGVAVRDPIDEPIGADVFDEPVGRADDTNAFRRNPAPDQDPWDAAAPAPRQAGTYVIRTSDTFWSISRKVYSTARYYKGLARFNRDLVPDPRRMRPGLELRVPDPAVLEKQYPDLFPSAGATPVATAQIDTRQPAGLYVDSNNRPVYRVGRNDSLSRIAHRHLGRSSRWVQIYDLNRNQLKSPSAIRPGMLLAMPSDASHVSAASARAFRR